MDAFVIPLFKLYHTNNKAYVIPNYQRQFAWGSSKAIELLSAILQDSNEDAKMTSLGTLLLCEIVGPNPNGNNTRSTIAPSMMMEVVDGQQRFTIFSIIGYALKGRYDHLTTNERLICSPPLPHEFDMFFSTSHNKRGTEVPVLIRDGDNYDTGFNSDLAKMLVSFTKNVWPPEGVGSRLLETAEAIFKWVNEELNLENFAKFSHHLLSRCTVVEVIADNQDSAFTMFETLNSTSEPLTALEVYRSKVVKKLSLQFNKTDQLLAYDVSKRDEVILRSNTLIHNMAQVNSGARPRIAFLPLKNYLDDQINLQFVNHFEDAADFFRTVWFDQTETDTWFDDEAKNCVRFLKAVKHDVAISLLLRYWLTQRTDLGKVLKIVVAFYSLWRAGQTTRNLPEVYRALLSKGSMDDLSIAGGNPLKSVVELAIYFKQKLTEIIGPLVAQQTSMDKWLLQTNLNYVNNKTLSRLFIFIHIGDTIKFNLVPNDPWTLIDDVEHILPFALASSLPNIHDVGNLTFLPSKVNKSLKDTPWEEKREVYEWLANSRRGNAPNNYTSTQRTVPRGAKEFINGTMSPALAHLENLASNVTWGEAEIKNRSAEILERVWNVLFKSWLHP